MDSYSFQNKTKQSITDFVKFICDCEQYSPIYNLRELKGSLVLCFDNENSLCITFNENFSSIDSKVDTILDNDEMVTESVQKDIDYHNESSLFPSHINENSSIESPTDNTECNNTNDEVVINIINDEHLDIVDISYSVDELNSESDAMIVLSFCF